MELKQYVEDAHASGFVGVLHYYVFYDEVVDRQVGLFGREHLTLTRSKLAAQRLARDRQVQAEFSHLWSGPQDRG